RWLGGMLTNFRTVKQSIKRLKDLDQMIEDGSLDRVTKKERLSITRERDKLQSSLGGIKDMEFLPDCLFVVDVGHEKIAISEAVKLGIPVVGIVDTNNSPDGIDYVVPGNDDAIRSIELYVTGAADAIIDSRQAAQIEDVKAAAEGRSDSYAGGRGKRREPAAAEAVPEASPGASPEASPEAMAEAAPTEGADATVAGGETGESTSQA
ncbi:MAG: 30S ribosomal protein S2, partial [Gammaproteobacteria bacterium]|nr:30S ribosomal protein S2 [Gammaproteobacteria bacterium]